LIDEKRLDFTEYSRDTKDGPKQVKSCVTVKVTQPSKKVRENIRGFTWLAYPLKELAKEFNDISTFKAEASAGETIRFTSYGLGCDFESYDADDEFTQRRQDEFFNSIFTTWQKKVGDKSGKKQSLCLGSDILAEQVRVFRKDHNIDLDWIVEGDIAATVKNQATILTKMVLNKIGKTRYVLSKTFFAGSKNGANIYRKLVVMKPAEDKTSVSYETALYGAIESHLLSIYDVNISTNDMSKEIKKLKKANEKLVEKLKHQDLESESLKALKVKYERCLRQKKEFGIELEYKRKQTSWLYKNADIDDEDCHWFKPERAKAFNAYCDSIEEPYEAMKKVRQKRITEERKAKREAEASSKKRKRQKTDDDEY
jgi:hypothetical protein